MEDYRELKRSNSTPTTSPNPQLPYPKPPPHGYSMCVYVGVTCVYVGVCMWFCVCMWVCHVHKSYAKINHFFLQ